MSVNGLLLLIFHENKPVCVSKNLEHVYKEMILIPNISVNLCYNIQFKPST